MNNEQLLQLALGFTPGVGPVNGKTLLSYSGSIEAVFSESTRTLTKIPGIGHVTAKAIKSKSGILLAEKEQKILEKKSISFKFYLDKDYPNRLKQYQDAPLVLFYKGSLPDSDKRTVGIVGTRTPSPYGVEACSNLVEELQDYGVSTISGLAYGIDTIAHRKSIQYQIPSYGILGQGINAVYPAQNRKMADRMCEQGGIISEFSFETKPDKENFPRRNRIIAGLSDALIVVESAQKGGSMITANLANDYYKDVFAIPGRINDEKSAGCNRLIKQNKAHLIHSAADLAYIMSWDSEEKNEIQLSLPIDLTEGEIKLIDHLKSNTNQNTIDQIHYNLKVSLSDLAAMLLNLEFKGIIRSLPGKKYKLAK